jgi:AraC-like DNA-binding protein
VVISLQASSSPSDATTFAVGVERISYHRVTALAGVEVLRCDESLRPWAWRHTAYALCTAVSFDGALEYRHRGRERRATAVNQLVFEPGEVHTSRAPSKPVSFRVLFLEPDAMERAALELGVPGGKPSFRDDALDAPALRSICRSFHLGLELGVRSALEIESRFTACLREWVGAGQRVSPVRGMESRARSIRVTEEYLNAHATRTVTLDELSVLSGLSRFHLAREFKRVVGVPPHTYQLLLRIALARRLLEQGASRAEAAARAGFVDASHLARHFKRLVGVSPGRFHPMARRR